MYFIQNLSLQLRYNQHIGVSNHQRLDCLLNRLFRPRSKKASNHRVTGPYGGNSPVTDEVPEQRANNAENVSIWWRHHVVVQYNHTVLFKAQCYQRCHVYVFTGHISFRFGYNLNIALCYWDQCACVPAFYLQNMPKKYVLAIDFISQNWKRYAAETLLNGGTDLSHLINIMLSFIQSINWLPALQTIASISFHTTSARDNPSIERSSYNMVKFLQTTHCIHTMAEIRSLNLCYVSHYVITMLRNSALYYTPDCKICKSTVM